MFSHRLTIKLVAYRVVATLQASLLIPEIADQNHIVVHGAPREGEPFAIA